MNPEESLGELELEPEPESEEEEKTICARLILTKEQVAFTASSVEFLGAGLPLAPYLTSAPGFPRPRLGLSRGWDLNYAGARSQEDDLRQAFNLLDYAGEGKIKADDFRVAIKALGYEPTNEELQHMINGVDKGQTGKLSFENFQTAIMRKIMLQDNDGDIMKSFRLFDVDDSGLISFENLKHVAGILGADLSDQEIEEMIDDADKDFDGFISVQEFMRMIKNSVHIVTP